MVWYWRIKFLWSGFREREDIDVSRYFILINEWKFFLVNFLYLFKWLILKLFLEINKWKIIIKREKTGKIYFFLVNEIFLFGVDM